MINIDMKCAGYAREMVEALNSKDSENIIQKALGVLLENGPYAMYIYCASKKYNDVNNAIQKLLTDIQINLSSKTGLKEVLTEIADNLDMLLFSKDLIERTLTYARYHAKAENR